MILLDSKIAEQKTRLDIIRRTCLDAAREMIDGAYNKESLRGLLAREAAERNMLESLLQEVDA